MDSHGFDMPLSRTLDEQTDPFSTSIVDDLLSSLTDWRGVNDIVRLTLRALTDAVKSQSASIRELERLIPNKADWSEVVAEMAVKANVSEVSRSLAEVSDELQAKVRMSDVQRLLDEKVSRSDMQFALGTKVSVDEFRNQLDTKAAAKDVESDYRELQLTIQKLKDEEVSHLFRLVDTKAGIQEVCEALDEKANQQNFADALKNKVTRLELESLLNSKIDQTDLDRLAVKLERKADMKEIERMETALHKKLEKREVTDLILQEVAPLAAKAEVEGLHASIISSKKQTELRLDEQFMELENFLASIKSEFDGMYAALSSSVSRKADLKSIEEIHGKLGNVVEFEHFDSVLNQVKADVQAKVDRVFESSNIEGRLSLLEQLKTQVYELASGKKTVEQQHDDFKRHIVEYCSSSTADLTEDLRSLKGDLSTLCETQQEILVENENRFVSFKKLVDSLSSDVKDHLTALQRDFNRDFIKVKDETETRLANHEKSIDAFMKQRRESRTLESAIEQKADVALCHQLSSSIEALKLSHSDFNTSLTSKQYLFEGKLFELTASLAELASSQPNLTALHKAIEQKVDIRDFKRTAVEFKDQLKVVTDDFQSHLADQTLINETLCAENVVARWAWKSRNLAGAIVPWEEQSVNTCPENFLWAKDTTNLIAVTPGLYEIIFGFFARHKPTITLLVNGEPVLQRVVRTAKTPRGQASVAGVTQVEFLVLPGRASVSVNYSGDPGEGFIGLKKL